jgi:hypothetical protein
MWVTILLGGIKSLIQRLYRLAVDYPLQAAIIALLCLSGWLYAGKQDALDTVAARNVTIAEMKKASEVAGAAQIALFNANTEKQTQIARLTDANETNRRFVADLSSDYANSMSAESYCREASAAAESDTAKSGDGASADAIVVSRADFDILTDNTARLMDVRAWGQKLIDDGLAEKLSDSLPVK